jgi:hypothetical protein
MPPALTLWQNFYVIVGSAAGALTGLQFIVITLIAQTRTGGSMRDIRAFGTPTVVHFCTALLMSAVMAAPWESLAQLGICLFVYGALGTLFSVRTLWHARKAAYSPDLEDWIWYTALPLIAHLALIAAGILLCWKPVSGLLVAGTDSLVFLLLGIHNSWDTVTYLVVQHGRRRPGTDESDSPLA